MSSGYLALVLHAHLPFVRHPEHEEFLEEEWLFEAITETYLPLIAMMQRLVRDGVPFQLTMSVSRRRSAPCCRTNCCEIATSGTSTARSISPRVKWSATATTNRSEGCRNFITRTLAECRGRFLGCGGDLLGEFRKLRDDGCLEIMATAATHGLLPVLQPSPAAARAQILIGCDIYRAAFGADPAGFWLPECAYAPGLETIMQEANLRWFILDAHGLMFGEPRPRRANLRAVLHRGRPRRVRAGPRFEPAGLERDGGVSGRSGLP